MTDQTRRIAAVQLCTTADVVENNAAIMSGIAEAVAEGAWMISLPEAANILLRDNMLYFAQCVPEAEDSTLAMCRDKAREHAVWLHVGSLLVRIADKDRVWNRSYMISPEGTIVARYDKLHTFDVFLGDGADFVESRAVAPGQLGAVAVDVDEFRVGLSICYDLRFPHLFQALARAGAGMLMIPASFSVVTGPLHWEALLKARAIETGSYVVAAAQCGTRDGVTTFGQSRIISPFGEVLAAAGDESTVILADVNWEQVRRTRERIPSLEQARSLGDVLVF
jgi:predicted amidohydrolase